MKEADEVIGMKEADEAIGMRESLYSRNRWN